MFEHIMCISNHDVGYTFRHIHIKRDLYLFNAVVVRMETGQIFEMNVSFYLPLKFQFRHVGRRKGYAGLAHRPCGS